MVTALKLASLTSIIKCMLVEHGTQCVLQDFIYPENVAYPIGGPGSARFLVMEMHYDNPDMRSGTYVNGVLDNKDTTCFVWCEGEVEL